MNCGKLCGRITSCWLSHRFRDSAEVVAGRRKKLPAPRLRFDCCRPRRRRVSTQVRQFKSPPSNQLRQLRCQNGLARWRRSQRQAHAVCEGARALQLGFYHEWCLSGDFSRLGYPIRPNHQHVSGRGLSDGESDPIEAMTPGASLAWPDRVGRGGGRRIATDREPPKVWGG
jgi:hypothetical protein